MKSITSSIIGHILGNKWILMALNIVIPIAIYFEAGPVSAIAAYFGYFLLVSLAMHLKREADREKSMHEILGSTIKDALKKAGETTDFETDDYKGSITEIKFDDLPEEIREMMDKKEKKEKDEDEDTKNVTKH